MKLLIQTLFVFGLLALFCFMNSCVNTMKRGECVRSGGQFILNTSDANRSACIMGN